MNIKHSISLKKIYKHYYKSEKDNSVGIILAKFSDIEFIIPFFEKYPILGQKSLDFEDFKKVAKLVKIKNHLTMIAATY